jgi:hypothetical protein
MEGGINAAVQAALAGVVLAFASACGLAPASVITVNVTGTTTHDPASLFGSLGSHISVVYTFDTSLGIFSGNDI